LNRFMKLIVLIVCLVPLLAVSGCGRGRVTVRTEPEPVYRPYPEGTGPPPHAPAVGYRRKHSYWYYPSSHVYYDPGRSLYFYMENGHWQAGVRLPSSFHLTVGEAVAIEMDVDRPYLEFETHRSKYPPGHPKSLKGKGKDKGREKDKGKEKGKKK